MVDVSDLRRRREAIVSLFGYWNVTAKRRRNEDEK